MAPETPQSWGSIYEIRLRGVLGSEWSQWFDGLDIRPAPDGDTWLVGPLPDQAALHGLLAKIRDVGLPIVLVRRLDVHAEEETDEY